MSSPEVEEEEPEQDDILLDDDLKDIDISDGVGLYMKEVQRTPSWIIKVK